MRFNSFSIGQNIFITFISIVAIRIPPNNYEFFEDTIQENQHFVNISAYLFFVHYYTKL